jgi:3-oxoacyl-[acyl-carrier protein] reductase
MRERGWGRIVNVTSVGVKEPLPNLVLSNALRAAVVGYSKSLAREVARDGVLVHSVMPGSFLTDRNRELGAAIARERGVELDELIDSWARDVPVGRMGDPLEFGRMVAFLASDLCSFSTGTAIPVEGGALRGVL